MVRTSAVSVRLLVAALAGLLASPPSRAGGIVLAQAGSTGGTLGDDEKSVSGAQRAPAMKKPAKAAEPAVSRARSVPPPPHPRLAARPAVEAPPAPRPLRRQAKAAGVALATYDGTWTGASTGACIPRWRWSFTVVNGIMTGDSGSNISGRIRPDGDTAGKMVVFGSTYDFTGQMDATRVAGTWVKLGEDGCTGTWSARK